MDHIAFKKVTGTPGTPTPAGLNCVPHGDCRRRRNAKVFRSVRKPYQSNWPKPSTTLERLAVISVEPWPFFGGEEGDADESQG